MGEEAVNALTLIMPYYDNPSMLEEQQRQWQKYPTELRARLHVIIVDDGSPRWEALSHVQQPPESLGLASFRLYRTLVDVRWNWLFCRNLGVSEATTLWVLMTDIDHVMPTKTLAYLLDAKLNPRKAYRFSRVDAPNKTPYKPHPNTWLVTRDHFDRIGGYDERFSGFYGTDGEFRRRVQDNSEEIVILPQVMVRYPREVISDASTTTYGRKEPVDRTNVRRIFLERAEERGWKTKRLTFPYERQI
jgi:hypothetical protein